MKKMRKIVFVSVISILLLCAFVVSPASAVSVIWKAPNVDVTLKLSATSLEFEDPCAVGKIVNGYTILDWRDADYNKPGHPMYDEWTASGSGTVDGSINQIRMRNAGQQISTTTTAASNIVSVHITGDSNDGQTEIWVDGSRCAALDMGTAGLPQTALIVVRNLATTTHTIVVKDMGSGAISHLGDDVHIFGAAALRPNWNATWWPNFCFLDARIELVYTNIWIGVPTGFWCGWWPWYYEGCWLRPWCGPIGWYEPYCWTWWYRPYWNYWPWYQSYRPWWHYWNWQGGRWFYGFTDYLSYRYTSLTTRIIYYWSCYWKFSNQGGVMEIVTQADESNPAGKRILPFTTPSIPGFEAGTHRFSVNGGKATGTFSSLTFIQTSNLKTYYQGLPGVTADDVNALMDCEVVKELMNNDPCGQGYIGVQNGSWIDPQPNLNLNVPSEIQIVYPARDSNDNCTIDINLPAQPLYAETYAIVPSDSGLAFDKNEITFTPSNWFSPQRLTVSAADVNGTRENHTTRFSIFSEVDPNKGVTVPVYIYYNQCGGLGYLAGDFNRDCIVNFKDFDVFADDWCAITDPNILRQ